MPTATTGATDGVSVAAATKAADVPSVLKDVPAKAQHPLNRRWTLWYDSPATYNTENWELSLLPIMSVSTVEEFFVMLRYMKPLHDLRTSSQYHLFQEGVKPMWEDPANVDGGKVWVNIDIPTANGNSANNTPGSIATPAGTNGTAATTAAVKSGGNAGEEPPRKDDKSAAASATATAATAAGTNAKPELDLLWERVLMAVVGESLEPDAEKDAEAPPQIVGVVMAKRKYHNRLALWVRSAKNTAAIDHIRKSVKEVASLPASASLVFTKHGENAGKS